MSIMQNNPQKRAKDDAMVLRYRVYSRRIRLMLSLGCVLQERTRSTAWSYFSGLLVIFMSFTQIVFLLNACFHTDDLVVISRCLSITGGFLTCVITSTCFLIKREKLMELHKTLNDLFERELARNQETKTTMLALLPGFDRLAYMLCFTLEMIILLIFYPSVSYMYRQIKHHVKPRTYKLPFPGMYFWPLNDLSFCLHFVHHMMIGWWSCFTTASVDGLFGYYAFQICAILRAMSFRLANTRQTQKEFIELLGTCVQTHHQLLQCSHTLSDIWGLIIIRMIIANAIIICTLIFEVFPFTNLALNQIFLFIVYFWMKLLQTFVYAWYGSLITSASEDFREGIYFSEWPNSSLDHEVRTNVIMTMMQKPIIITALKLSSVNINMFTNIVNTAMSYFFLLQSLDEGK